MQILLRVLPDATNGSRYLHFSAPSGAMTAADEYNTPRSPSAAPAAATDLSPAAQKQQVRNLVDGTKFSTRVPLNLVRSDDTSCVYTVSAVPVLSLVPQRGTAVLECTHRRRQSTFEFECIHSNHDSNAARCINIVYLANRK